MNAIAALFLSQTFTRDKTVKLRKMEKMLISLWKKSMPEKIKVFIWRAVHDILPTNDKLQMKRVEVDPCCKACGCEDETAIHCLKQCPIAKQVWLISDMGVRTEMSAAVSVEDWVMEALIVYDKNQFIRFCVTAWCLWNGRNAAIFEQEEMQPLEIAKKAFLLGAECSAGTDSGRTATAQNERGQISWEAPSEGWVKINTNGAIFENGVGGVGVLIRNQKGQMMAGLAKKYDVALSIENIEALAVKEGMELTERNGYTKVIVESDCANLVHKLLAANTGLDSSENVLCNIKRMC